MATWFGSYSVVRFRAPDGGGSGSPGLENRIPQEDAIVAGMEAELTIHLMDRDTERFHLVLSGDWAYLAAIEVDEALPRNPPARARAGL